MRRNSVKNNRINGEVAKELSMIIRGLKDPRISPMASVMTAEVTADLKYCKVFVSVLGSEEEQKAPMQGLKNANGHVRSELAKRLNLRNTPELLFVLDTSIEYGVRMSKLIDEVTENDRANSTGTDAEEENESEE